MARPTINANNCGYTYYKYYFNSVATGKKSSNYLPIIIIELPYSESELGINYGVLDMRPDEMGSFGTSISEMLGNHLPCILSMSRSSGVVSSAFPWTSYEDNNFKSQLTLSQSTNSDNELVRTVALSLNLERIYNVSVFNLGGFLNLIEDKKYEDEDETVAIGLFLCLLRTTSGTLYYDNGGFYVKSNCMHC